MLDDTQVGDRTSLFITSCFSPPMFTFQLVIHVRTTETTTDAKPVHSFTIYATARWWLQQRRQRRFPDTRAIKYGAEGWYDGANAGLARWSKQ